MKAARRPRCRPATTRSPASKRRSRATSTSKSPSASPVFRFVGGKGGVGKTTCAAAIAVESASAGARTLLVSTDPAPSLGDLFGIPIGTSPTRIQLGGRSFRAVEIDAGRTLRRWLESRTPVLEEIAVRGTWLDREDVSRLLRQALPGIDEIAALLEIAKLSRSPTYDTVVVDTAPTGHTLRMFAMAGALRGLARVFDDMQAKHRQMVAALSGAWRGDAADALIEELEADGAGLQALLRDAARVQMTWVMLPEPMAVEETRDAIATLDRQGMRVNRLVVNRVTPAPPQACRWCAARRRFEQRTIVAAQRTLRDLDFAAVPAQQPEPRGPRALLKIAAALRAPFPAVRPVRSGPARPVRAAFPLGSQAADPLGAGSASLLMFGGKGGVGKTTCAAATALEIARRKRGTRVLLISTDPAHSLADVLGRPVSDQARSLRGEDHNLRVRELDAAKQFAVIRDRYGEAIDAMFDRLIRSGPFDASHDRQVMHDLIELAPPGVDELAAVLEVTETIADPKPPYDLVVMDTAPSGHALRLLEMPGVVQDWAKALMGIVLKYQPVVGAGDLGRLLLSLSQGLGRLRELLADPSRTRFIAVTRAEALARAETARLLDRLRRLGIPTPMVVINAAGAGTCRNCTRQRAAQQKVLAALAQDAKRRRAAVAVAPAEMPPPMGCAGLVRWRGAWRMAAEAGGGISSS